MDPDGDSVICVASLSSEAQRILVIDSAEPEKRCILVCVEGVVPECPGGHGRARRAGKSPARRAALVKIRLEEPRVTEQDHVVGEGGIARTLAFALVIHILGAIAVNGDRDADLDGVVPLDP